MSSILEQEPGIAGQEPGARVRFAQRLLILGLVFVVVLAIYPYTPNPAADVKILVVELAAFAAFALWVFTPQRSGPRSLQAYAVLAFAALTAVSAILSVNPGYSVCREYTRWLALLAVFVATANAFRTPRRVWTLAATICVSMTLASLYGLAQRRGLDPFPWKDTSGMLLRAPSTFGNPNFASHALTPALILACGLCFQRKGRWALLCIAVLLAHLAITRTRGSILGLSGASLLVMAAVVVARRRPRPTRGIAVTLGALLFVGIVGATSAGVISTWRTGQLFPYDIGESIMLRYHSFYGACRMIHDRPWFGYGPGMYEVASPSYWTPLQKDRFDELRKADDHVHCEPLEIAVESGLPAAIAYVAIFALGMYYGLRMWFAPKKPGARSIGLTLAACFFAVFLDGLFGFNVHVPVSALLIFLIAGAATGVWRESEGVAPAKGARWGLVSFAWRAGAVACCALVPWLAIRNFWGEVLTQRGFGAIAYNAFPAARENFARAEALEPFAWIPSYYQGVLAMQRDALDDAERHFSRTLKLNPDYLAAQFTLAKTLFNLAQRSPGMIDRATLDRAIACAQRAANISPQFQEVQELLGRTAYLRAETRGRGRGRPSPGGVRLDGSRAFAPQRGRAGRQRTISPVPIGRRSAPPTKRHVGRPGGAGPRGGRQTV